MTAEDEAQIALLTHHLELAVQSMTVLTAEVDELRSRIDRLTEDLEKERAARLRDREFATAMGPERGQPI